MVPTIENELCGNDELVKFNMIASKILGIDGARVRDWLSAMMDIDSLKDWNQRGQILFWIDMGNSWAHDRMLEENVDAVVDMYATLARRMHRKFEYVVYISAGDKPTPRWGSMNLALARRVHARIRDIIRPYARNQLMIDDYWLRLKRDIPQICDTYDQGYHFVYYLANANPAENLARRSIYAKELFDLFLCIKFVMKSMAYEWKDIYGLEGAPPMPVRTI